MNKLFLPKDSQQQPQDSTSISSERRDNSSFNSVWNNNSNGINNNITSTNSSTSKFNYQSTSGLVPGKVNGTQPISASETGANIIQEQNNKIDKDDFISRATNSVNGIYSLHNTQGPLFYRDPFAFNSTNLDQQINSISSSSTVQQHNLFGFSQNSAFMDPDLLLQQQQQQKTYELGALTFSNSTAKTMPFNPFSSPLQNTDSQQQHLQKYQQQLQRQQQQYTNQVAVQQNQIKSPPLNASSAASNSFSQIPIGKQPQASPGSSQRSLPQQQQQQQQQQLFNPITGLPFVGAPPGDSQKYRSMQSNTMQAPVFDPSEFPSLTGAIPNPTIPPVSSPSASSSTSGNAASSSVPNNHATGQSNGNLGFANSLAGLTIHSSRISGLHANAQTSSITSKLSVDTNASQQSLGGEFLNYKEDFPALGSRISHDFQLNPLPFSGALATNSTEVPLDAVPPSSNLGAVGSGSFLHTGSSNFKSFGASEADNLSAWPHQSEKEKPIKNKAELYGMRGLLNIIHLKNAEDKDSALLSIGIDLTLLGLNLNSQEPLYASFDTPWTDKPMQSSIPNTKEHEFQLPSCYIMPQQSLKISHFAKFQVHTLFYIFYNMPKNPMQLHAALELYNRDWRYHKELKLWFTRRRGVYIYFDIVSFGRRPFHEPTVSFLQGFLTEDEIRAYRTQPQQL